MKSLLLAAVLGLGVTACGGGGGGSSPVPGPGPSTAPTRATLKGGFGAGTGTSALTRQPLALSGALVPIANFVVADSYVGYKPYAPISINAVAYYDPTAGPVPSTLPTVTAWTVTGAASATVSNALSGPGLLGKLDSIGQTLITSSGVVGTGSLNAAASNGDAVSLPYNVYPATALDAETSYTPAQTGVPGANTKPCLTFTATTAVPGIVGDICLTINADKTVSVTAPLGIALVSKTIDQMKASDISAIVSTSVAITAPSFSSLVQTTYSFEFKTALGNYVKFSPVFINANGDVKVSAGQPIYAFGSYRIGTASGWDI